MTQWRGGGVSSDYLAVPTPSRSRKRRQGKRDRDRDRGRDREINKTTTRR